MNGFKSFIRFIFVDLFKKIKFWVTNDRLGPDMVLTSWMLHFKSLMLWICKKKFKYFDDTAEFRPGAYAVCSSKISLGKRVVIRPMSLLQADDYAEIIIEDDVLLAAGVYIYVSSHKYDTIGVPVMDQGYYPSKSVVLKKGCWIGSNATILPGVTVGQNAVVGARVVVTKSIPDYGIILNQNFTTVE
jgi:acetyltransferase-like isoleucine patch superfamily enzyme